MNSPESITHQPEGESTKNVIFFSNLCLVKNSTLNFSLLSRGISGRTPDSGLVVKNWQRFSKSEDSNNERNVNVGTGHGKRCVCLEDQQKPPTLLLDNL